MTVEELISALAKLDQKALVVIPHEWDIVQRTIVTSVEVERVERLPAYIAVADEGPETVVSIS